MWSPVRCNIYFANLYVAVWAEGVLDVICGDGSNSNSEFVVLTLELHNPGKLKDCFSELHRCGGGGGVNRVLYDATKKC